MKINLHIFGRVLEVSFGKKKSEIEAVSDRFREARIKEQANPQKLTSLQRRMQSGDY
jgi:hypothetical protein